MSIGIKDFKYKGKITVRIQSWILTKVKIQRPPKSDSGKWDFVVKMHVKRFQMKLEMKVVFLLENCL